MGWKETCALDERMRFVMAAEAQEEPMAALCRRFGVSRKSGYKWLERYRSEGVAGLVDRSRAPLDHPQAVSAEIAGRCLAVRRAHPTWGPVKVRAFLIRREPAITYPTDWVERAVMRELACSAGVAVTVTSPKRTSSPTPTSRMSRKPRRILRVPVGATMGSSRPSRRSEGRSRWS